MSSRFQWHAGLIAFSLVVAVSLFKLASQFHPEGILGGLQEALQFLFVFPYVVGLFLGGNPHGPNDGGVFLGFFIEVYALAFIGWSVVGLLR